MRKITPSKQAIYKWLFLFIILAPVHMQAQEKIAGTPVNKSSTVSLNHVFKNYSLFTINAPKLAQHAKANSNGIINFELDFGGLSAMKISLEKNDILSPNYKLMGGTVEGKKVLAPSKSITYKGKLTGDNNSSVYLTISGKTIYGFIKGNGKEYFIEPLRYFNKQATTDQFVLYETKDVIPHKGIACGVKDVQQKLKETINEPNTSSRIVGAGCKMVEIAIASDESMFLKYGSVEEVEEHNISVLNAMTGIYSNTLIGNSYLDFKLVGQYVATTNEGNPLIPNYVGNDMFILRDNFAAWGEAGNFNSTYDLGQLWSARNADDFIDGLAMDIGTVCTSLRYNVCKDLGGSLSYLAALSAHEIGHCLGAYHDGDFLAPYIMGNLYANPTPVTFSTESISQMNSYLSRPEVTCLAACSAPIAQFSASAMTICVGSTVTFTDNSIGVITQRNWSFQDGSPSSSANNTEVVTFATAGTKTIQLTVTNELGSSSITKTILVAEAGSVIPGTLSASSTEVCKNVTHTLTFTGNIPGSTLEYYNSNLGTWTPWVPIGNEPLVIETYFYDPLFDIWRVKFSLGGCTVVSNSVRVDYLLVPRPVITQQYINPCGSDAIQLNVADQNINAAPYLSYEWQPGGETVAAITVNPAAATLYRAYVTGANGCSNSAATMAYPFKGALPVPVIQSGVSGLVCTGSGTTLSFTGTKTVTGCTNDVYGQFPATAYSFANSNGSYGVITKGGYAGEYSMLNVEAGKYYAFKSLTNSGSILDDVVTISTADGNSTLATGIHLAVWKASYNGQVRFYTHTSDCGSKEEGRQRLAACAVSATAFGSLKWMPGGQTTDAITVNPSSSTIYSLTFTNESGCSGTSTVNIITGIGAVELSTTNITCNSATLNWASPFNPSQWQLEYKSTARGSKWINVPVPVASTRSFTVTGLKRDQNYQWHIRAKCGKAWTPYSDAVAFKALPNCIGSTVQTRTSNAMTPENEVKELMENLKVVAMPNPSNTSFRIVIDGSNLKEPVKLIVTDILGRVVETKITNTGKTITIGETYRSGLYLIRAMQGKEQKLLKLIKLD